MHAVGIVAATTFFRFVFVLHFFFFHSFTLLHRFKWSIFLRISRVSGREYVVLLMHGCRFEDVCACVCKMNKIARKKRNGMKNEKKKKWFARWDVCLMLVCVHCVHMCIFSAPSFVSISSYFHTNTRERGGVRLPALSVFTCNRKQNPWFCF